ncbi:MAG: bacillithiol biosynthesis cysteine-adding enzyme BshC [Bacteroidetes bacterium]|nr:bacillithiol biosynthesis cysteine-adding enzyme BshC [Bacteroidota bacterium]MBS1758209.1 bacillithiol biosynthesis cysteine-adding enzyme BshC [Bacteroidota bacterium]
MNVTASHIPYSHTNAFSTMVLDYLHDAPGLRPFYQHKPTLDGIKQAIEERKNFKYNRALLVEQLQKQYHAIATTDAVKHNIEALLSENTFTICTAHQPNIFTGHLYFIYKILHAIKLAATLKEQLSQYNFVPVYYIGSEDADLQELGEVCINTKKYQWHTKQTGAVGRMKVDKELLKIIDEIEGQISIDPYGKEIMDSVRSAYSIHKTIEQATFEFTNTLFASYGLVVLMPDNAALKKEYSQIMWQELTNNFSAKAVADTVSELPSSYKVQAAGRDINLFYLLDDSRQRIEKAGDVWKIVHTNKHFTKDELFQDLQNNPERYSPNVILRPVYQEMILPNIAFIGGGGELAYWLELKKVFEQAKVPYPVLVLRNSFMLVNKKNANAMAKLSLPAEDFFSPVLDIINTIVKKASEHQWSLEEEKAGLKKLYHAIQTAARQADTTLQAHVEALQVQALKKVEALENKMLKAARHKFDAEQRQVNKLKQALFPGNNLQERVDNILPYYSMYGKNILEALYQHSNALQQDFTILTEE